MSNLEKLVPPLEMCKAAVEKYPEAWRRDFARSEWEQTALCWRTFNPGRRDEYTIVFFTGSLDYESGDVNAPTLAEILAVLPDGMAAVTRRQSGGWCAIAPDHGFPEDDPNPTAAVMRLWINIQEASR